MSLMQFLEAMSAADTSMQLAAKRAELRAEIARIGTRCGHCDKWMKSSECPAERNISGMSRGPSCEGFKCQQFVESSFATKFREQKKAEQTNTRSNAKAGEVESVYVECRQCDVCDHIGINDASATEGACHNCDWSGPEQAEDKCPKCGDTDCMAAACPECGSRYALLADTRIALSTHDKTKA